MIILDASVLIAQLDPTDLNHARAERLLDAVAEEEFAASPLTLAEVLVHPTRDGRAAEILGHLRRLGVLTVPLDEGSPARLAELRVATRRRLPDCCVLLAAEQADAEVLTFDDDLMAAASQIGLRTRA